MQLPLFEPQRPASDWLIKPAGKAGLFRTADKRELVLSNGLIARTFRLEPDCATVGIRNLMTQNEMLRAVKPEASLTLDGKLWNLGGLKGQPDLAYLTPAWLDRMTADPEAFHLTGYAQEAVVKRFDWKPLKGVSPHDWPPKGVRLTLNFANPSLPGILVAVHYEAYDGIPVFAKWITVENHSAKTVRLNTYSHTTAYTEADSIVDDTPGWALPDVTVVSDYSFGGMSQRNSNRTAEWVPDKSYGSQVNYNLNTPCDLRVSPPLGPEKDIKPGESFESFRSFQLIHDSSERERKGLGVRRMFRTLAPWVTENPIMMHLTSVDPKVVHTAMDQAAECGFEMIILSFGSGLNMEDDSPENIAKFKAFADYAHSKGLGLGGYSLLASRHIDAENDVVNPKPVFGNSPCLASKWGLDYFRRLKHFIDATGFDLLEHDGSYPGDPCASTSHPGHRDEGDSQYEQYKIISEFYHWCRGHGVFLNVPDNYFLAGSNKTGMGYREVNWSLPRAQQHIHARQNLYDGTWEKAPSMGWMFTPLVEYQGGGPAATIEPLREHLEDYQMHLINNFSFGVQSCYRGPRLYDAPETRAAVIRWVSWFKKHREILESDVIHVRRADGRHLDAILHAHPGLDTPAMGLVFNPTDVPLRETIRFPLYYAGFSLPQCGAVIEGPGVKRLDLGAVSASNADVSVEVPARSFVWIEFR